MAIDFPTSPTVGQQVTSGSRTWSWSGSHWENNTITGVQGIQGIQGVQGTQGTQGTQGAQGLQGTQGLQGIQGVQGVQGTQGTQGTQGLQGITGTQGAVGSQGTQGTQGLQGIQGISGASILGTNNTFTGTNAFTSATFNASTSTVILKQNSSGGYAGLRIYNDQDSALRALEIDYSGSAYSGSLITGAPAGESAAITTTGAYPLVLGTSNTARLTISSSGNVGIGTASPAEKLDVSGRIQLVNSGFNYVKIDSTTSDAYLRLAYAGVNKWYFRNNITNSNNLEITPDAGSTIGLFIQQGGNVGIGTSSPSSLLHISNIVGLTTLGSAAALTISGKAGGSVVGERQEINFRSWDGLNTNGRSTAGFGFITTDVTSNEKGDLYFFTRSDTSGAAPTEKMRITSAGNVITSAGSAISYGAGETYIAWTDEPEYSIADSSADSNYKTMKTFVASKSGSFNFKFSGYIQSGTYYWGWRLLKNSATVASSGNYGSGLDTGQVSEVHAYRRFVGTVSSVTPGDIFQLQMVSSDGAGTPVAGNGQLLYAKEFRIYSTTPALDHGGSTNVFGNQVGIGTTSPQRRLDVRGTELHNASLSVTSTYGGACYILMGNQDSAGTNTPSAIVAANGEISFGVGNSWSSNVGGTFTSRVAINSTGLSVVGALSKGSGSFRIEHPLPSKSATHQLVHSFIEGPKCDLIYRGKVDLVDGKASVNIDTDSTMTEGTFEALCTTVQCFTSNESGWGAIRGKVIGNILTIEAQDSTSTDNVSWMVIGERKDPHILDTDWTDSNGRPIVEPLKPVEAALEATL